MSPSRTHPTGLDRIIGIVFFLYPRDILWEFLSDGNGRSSDLHPPSISLYVNIKKMQNSWQAVFPKKCQ